MTEVANLSLRIEELFAFLKSNAENKMLANLPLIGERIDDVSNQALQFLDEAQATILDALDFGQGMDAIAAALDGLDGVDASHDEMKDEIEISLGFIGSQTLDQISIGAEFGILAGIGLSADADFALERTHEANIDLVFDGSDGSLDITDGTLSVGLIGQANFAGEANLGFLSVDVVDARPPETPELTLDFTAQLVGGETIAGSGFDVALNGGAALDLDITTSAGSDWVPSITTGIRFGMDFAAAPLDPENGFVSDNSFELDDIRVSLPAIGRIIGGVLDRLEVVTDTFPLGQVIETLTREVKVLNAIGEIVEPLSGGDGTVTVGDVIILFASNNPDMEWLNKLAKIAQAVEYFRMISDFAGDGVLIGDFALAGDIATSLAKGEPIDIATFGDSFGEAAGALGVFGDVAADLIGQIKDQLQADGEEAPVDGEIDLAEMIRIPLLTAEGPALAAQFLLNGAGGAPISLVELDLPPLTFNETAEAVVRILGPLAVRFEGQFAGGIDVGAGYDTSGLQSLLAGDGVFGLLDGFYISTDPAEDGGFAPAAGLLAGFEAGAGLDAVALRAFVNGGVLGEIGLSLADNADGIVDGRTHLAQVDGCLFEEFFGSVTAGVNAKIEVGIGPFTLTKRFDILEEVLAQFEIDLSCPAGSAHGPQQLILEDIDLAELLDFADMPPLLPPIPGFEGTVLTLNVGDRAIERDLGTVGIGDDETFSVVPAGDDGTAVHVSAYGVREAFAMPDLIVANGALGDDAISIEVDVAAVIDGGAGNDRLWGGEHDDTLRGGEGEGADALHGGNGNDTLEGGGGNDFLDGGEGEDVLDGGAGFDQVTYEHSADAVVFARDDETGEITGSGGEAEGDVLIDVEHIVGTRVDDILVGPDGTPDEQSILEGLEGDDTLTGSGRSDLLIGGPGADLLVGGDEEDDADTGDGVSYISSLGAVTIDLANDVADGGDATGDVLVGIEGVGGSAYGDVLRGNAEDNFLAGSTGDDTLEGRAGQDTVEGEGGDDLVLATGDGDLLDGGGVINLERDSDWLSYRNAMGAVTANLETGSGRVSSLPFSPGDTIAFAMHAGDPLDPGQDAVVEGRSSFENLGGSSFNDRLTGDRGDNTIDGGAGKDVIDGGAGNDWLIGGTGPDTLRGGKGVDTADYSASNTGVTVNLATGTGAFGHAAGDRFSSIENLVGSMGNDVLTGNSANNRFAPLLGNDAVHGGDGTDTLALNLSGIASSDGMTFGAEAGGVGWHNVLNSPVPSNSAFTGIERFEIVGTNDDDDIAITGIGNDFINGEDGDDLIDAGLGRDRVFGGTGDDHMTANLDAAGDFTGRGGDPDELDGGRGVDTLSVDLGGVAGAVTLAMRADPVEDMSQSLSLPNGTAIRNVEVIATVGTGSGNDALVQPGRVDNIFSTGAGDDILAPGLGQDKVMGGESGVPGVSDVDVLVLNYAGHATTVIVDFDPEDGAGEAIAGTGPDGDRVVFSEIERLLFTGSDHADVVTGITDSDYDGPGDRIDGGAGADTLSGGGSDDVLIGGRDGDVLDGGDGDDRLVAGVAGVSDDVDTMTGGEGEDLFVLGDASGSFYGDATAAGTDYAVITDFSPDDGDRIQLAGGIEDYVLDDMADLWIVEAETGNAVAQLAGVNGLELEDIATFSGPGGTGVEPAALSDGVALALVELEAAFAGTGYEADVAAVSAALAAGTFDLADFVAQPLDTVDRAGDADAILAAVEAASAALPAENVPEPGIVGEGLQLTPADLIVQRLGGMLASSSVGQAELDGDRRAFGSFSGEFLGLDGGRSAQEGEGGIISTGIATDLDGRNTIDGGLLGALSTAAQARLEFVSIGTFGNAEIFRANLSGLTGELASIVLRDSASFVGGAGGERSGFDIDSIHLSSVRLDPAVGDIAVDEGGGLIPLDVVDLEAALSPLDVFDFSPNATFFEPGTQRAGLSGVDDARGVDLAGSSGGMVDATLATLGQTDASADGRSGSLSLGDGGMVVFNLTEVLAAQAGPLADPEAGGLYLYVAETGTGGAQGETLDGFVSASSDPFAKPGDLSTDFGAPGTADDTIRLSQDFTVDLGAAGDGQGFYTDLFQIVLATEELLEFAGREATDAFSIRLNGEEVLMLSDGAAPSMSNLANAPIGPYHDDLTYNGLGFGGGAMPAGPSIARTRADAFTEVLTVSGYVRNGTNTIEIEVEDGRDGLLDSAILFAPIATAPADGFDFVAADGAEPAEFEPGPVGRSLDAVFDTGGTGREGRGRELSDLFPDAGLPPRDEVADAALEVLDALL